MQLLTSFCLKLVLVMVCRAVFSSATARNVSGCFPLQSYRRDGHRMWVLPYMFRDCKQLDAPVNLEFTCAENQYIYIESVRYSAPNTYTWCDEEHMHGRDWTQCTEDAKPCYCCSRGYGNRVYDNLDACSISLNALARLGVMWKCNRETPSCGVSPVDMEYDCDFDTNRYCNFKGSNYLSRWVDIEYKCISKKGVIAGLVGIVLVVISIGTLVVYMLCCSPNCNFWKRQNSATEMEPENCNPELAQGIILNTSTAKPTTDEEEIDSYEQSYEANLELLEARSSAGDFIVNKVTEKQPW